MESFKKNATGIKKLDQQHQDIFRFLEDFQATLDEGGGAEVYNTLLDLLKAFCEGHFSLEDACMRKEKCPVAKKNSAEHRELIKLIESFQQRFDEKGYLQTDAQQLVDSVASWFGHHIGCIDVHLKKCINK